MQVRAAAVSQPVDQARRGDDVPIHSGRDDLESAEGHRHTLSNERKLGHLNRDTIALQPPPPENHTI